MSGGLLSGLERAEKSPYEGWKTNSFVSPENDEVCLIDDAGTSDDTNGSPKTKKCLSDEDRNPRDFKAKDSAFKIPKKTAENKGWFNSSFDETDHPCLRNCKERAFNEKQRNNYTNRNTRRNEIGYRLLRQGQGPHTPVTRKGQRPHSSATRQEQGPGTPITRWKHASPPGTFSDLRKSTQSRSQHEKILSCQVPFADTKCNGSLSSDNARTDSQKSFKTLNEEKQHNLSLLDEILEGKSVNTPLRVGLNKDENSRTDGTNSDTNFRTKTSISQQQDTPTSSKDTLSDDYYDDLFGDHCEKCTEKLSLDKKCPKCDKDIFPSQAATPRKPLSPDRFYSVDSQKPKVQRTYCKARGNGTRVLLEGSKNSTGSCQTTSRLKKRKNQTKSNSDSDSDYTPPRGKKRNGKQLKLSLPKKVDVITLSDEEEIVETTAKLTVEDQPESDKKASGSDSITVIPVSPTNSSGVLKEDVVKSNSDYSSLSSETAGKRKTPPSKDEQQAKKKADNVHGYQRDDLEIEIMIGQDVRIGTLACTAADPLKITCSNDEIKLKVDYGRKMISLTIHGNDIASFKIGHHSNSAIIVIGVTPGYALKVIQRVPNQGKFLNPGSAVASERDIVLEVSETIKPELIADLMEWVTDKLSKEFAELSLTEVERIKSYKSSASTSKETNQTPNEATSTPMTTRSRTYNTRTNSSKQPAVAAQRLIVYPPPPQPGGITVTSEDIPCLAPGEFLNDVIIDFYLKFVFFKKLKPEDRERTHILSSFFYKRLTQRNSNNSDSFSSTPDRMHSQVKTWTKNVDIFEKDFVFVPINESSHWYLAVICFPGHTGATYINEIPDEDDETNAEQNENSNTDTETEKESENDDNERDDDDDEELTPLATLQSTSARLKSRRKSLSKQSIKSQPCILVFDSLGSLRQRCMVNLRNYLRCEWRERKKDAEPRDFNKDNIKGSHPKVPEQDNFCDCGVFVLQYMESFFEDPITDFSLPIKKPDWFSLDRISQKRQDIRELIFNLKEAAEIDNS